MGISITGITCGV